MSVVWNENLHTVVMMTYLKSAVSEEHSSAKVVVVGGFVTFIYVLVLDFQRYTLFKIFN